MSFVEDATSISTGSKKRRILRACDKCRSKKIRCDYPSIPGDKCSNCITFNTECTHAELPKKRGPKGHADLLQQRVNKMETLLRKLQPEAYEEVIRSTTSESSVFPSNDENEIDETLSSVATSSLLSSNPMKDETPTNNPGPSQTNDDADLIHIELSERMKHLSVDATHEDRFFGQSSGFVFMQKAMEVKQEITQRQDKLYMRKESWQIHPWELADLEEPAPNYKFPEQDLMDSLIDLYFVHSNCVLPVLHRPTFERDIKLGKHTQNPFFGSVLLLVCAVGSRFSTDPRVLVDGSDNWHSAGYKYFSQVHMIRKSLMKTANLHELQSYCLAATYIQSMGSPQAIWTMVGIGLRFGQERGVHRRKRSNHRWTPEDELWKRSFWILILYERLMCSFLGRPASMHAEDYDLELPFDCDDEYWPSENPTTEPFKQPPGKPSYVSAFISTLKLGDILAFALRTIYAVNKFKTSLRHLNTDWEMEIVSKLDSSLNRWVDLVPVHLRWDPYRKDNTFFYQSSYVFIFYYYVQIQIHRPFIPSLGSKSPLSFPSLAICANAARSCSHVFESILNRQNASCGWVLYPRLEMPAFCVGTVLMINIWGGRKAGLHTDLQKEMEGVQHCLRYLEVSEKRVPIALRFRDLLMQLVHMGDGDPMTSEHPPPPSLKRERQFEVVLTSNNTTPISEHSPEPIPSLNSSPRPIIDMPTRRTSGPPQPNLSQFPREHPVKPRSFTVPSVEHLSNGPPTGPMVTQLPVYSDQLGQLPVHGYIDFSKYQGLGYHAQPMLAPISKDKGPAPGFDNLSVPTSSLSHPPPTRTNITDELDNESIYQMFAQFSETVSHSPDLAALPQQPPVHYVQGAGGNYGAFSDKNFAYGNQIANNLDDTMSMWSNAPLNFGLDDWSNYVASGGESFGYETDSPQQRT